MLALEINLHLLEGAQPVAFNDSAKKQTMRQAWWRVLVISALGGPRQEEGHDGEAVWGCTK